MKKVFKEFLYGILTRCKAEEKFKYLQNLYILSQKQGRNEDCYLNIMKIVIVIIKDSNDILTQEFEIIQ